MKQTAFQKEMHPQKKAYRKHNVGYDRWNEQSLCMLRITNKALRTWRIPVKPRFALRSTLLTPTSNQRRQNSANAIVQKIECPAKLFTPVQRQQGELIWDSEVLAIRQSKSRTKLIDVTTDHPPKSSPTNQSTTNAPYPRLWAKILLRLHSRLGNPTRNTKSANQRHWTDQNYFKTKVRMHAPMEWNFSTITMRTGVRESAGDRVKVAVLAHVTPQTRAT